MRLNWCTDCKRCKPAFDFNKSRRAASKLRHTCRSCDAVRHHNASQTPMGIVQHRLCVRHRVVFGHCRNVLKLIGLDSWTDVADYVLSTMPVGISEDWRSEAHIDHIKPFGACKTLEEKEAACHYTNLRLVTMRENLVKGATF